MKIPKETLDALRERPGSGHAGPAKSRAPEGITVESGVFPGDLFSGPRERAARKYDVQRWTEMPQGGHFREI